ncbi:hypothetical protein [Phaeobacter inhibens]|uniref:hypothetical protein n=1 Tax=Phaeobacter inhibens TaxID=221822 RepID=UPI00248FE815|nr:hypothetical protein [Phaeobacter inhibens]
MNYWICKDVSDIPKIIPLIHEAHLASNLRRIPLNIQKIESIVQKSLSKKESSAIMLAGRRGMVEGAAYCEVGEYIIGSKILLTTIHGIFVSNRLRKSLAGGRVALSLFKGIETWSTSRKSSAIWLHDTFGIDEGRTHKLVRKIGFSTAGATYFKNTPLR